MVRGRKSLTLKRGSQLKWNSKTASHRSVTMYKVLRVTNAIRPTPGEWLSDETVESLILAGWTVGIT